MTKLHKFCYYTPLKVSLIGVAGAYLFFLIFVSIALKTDTTPMEHRSTFNDPSVYILVFYILYYILSGISLLLIFLNLSKSVRENKILSAFTFFACPLLFLLLLCPMTGNIFYAFGIALPMFVALGYYYRQFRIRFQSGELMDDYYYTYYE